jgi:Cu(I)/Ag(I) efflux system periplasmic protein CusF
MRRMIRTAPVVLATLMLLHGGAFAQSGLVDGQVTKIDESAGKVTLRHGPIKKLEMDEGMTMVFRIQDPAMLKGVKVGDKVKFDADRVDGQFTVTKLQKSK